MRVVAHHADRQLIGDPVIDSEADSAGREVVALRVAVAVHIDKVTEASHPHPPAIFRCRLEDRFHHALARIFRPHRLEASTYSPWRH